jgi:hypothetical protein
MDTQSYINLIKHNFFQKSCAYRTALHLLTLVPCDKLPRLLIQHFNQKVGYGQRSHRLFRDELQGYEAEKEHVLQVPHSGIQKGGRHKGLPATKTVRTAR